MVTMQWSFRKTGTMGTLASKAGASARVRGYYPLEKFEIVYAKSRNLVHFWPENGPQGRP